MAESEHGVVGTKVGHRLDIEKVVAHVVLYPPKSTRTICISIIQFENEKQHA